MAGRSQTRFIGKTLSLIRHAGTAASWLTGA